MTSGGPGASVMNDYCLGTGFPQVGESSYCGRTYVAGSFHTAESTGAHIVAQLTEVGVPPLDTKKFIYDNVSGPFLQYISSTDVRIVTVFPPGTDCNSLGMITDFGNADRQHCRYRLDYST